MKKVKLFEEFIDENLNEAKRGTIHKAAKKGNYPAVVVVIENGKVIHQESVVSPEHAPAVFNVMQEKYPKAKLSLEDKTGQILFQESVVTEYSGDGTNKISDDKLMNLIPKMSKGYVGKNTGTGEYTISTPGGEEIVLTQSKDKKNWSYEPSNIALKILNESIVTESVFSFKTDNIEQLHFETDPNTAELMKMELGKSQGAFGKKNQIEDAEYSLRRFRKKIGYGNGKDVGVFLPGSYDASVSTLGDGPHKKAVKKVRWSQKKYDQWLEDMASNGGAENAFDMAQNAKNEPGLIDWVKKEFRGDDPLQRIQWDIEGYAESVVTEAKDNLYLQLHKKYAEQIKGLKAGKIKKLTDLVSVQRWSMEEREDYFGMDSKKKKELSAEYNEERKLFKKYIAGDESVMLPKGTEALAESVVTESKSELMKIDSYLNTKDESVLIDFLDDAYGNSDDRKTRREWNDARKDLSYDELIDYAVAHAEDFGMDLQDIEDAVEVYESVVTEKREDVGKYNTVKKVIAKLGRRPSEQDLAQFITDNYYDVTEVERGDDDPQANDKIADLVGFYKFDIDDWQIAWFDAQNESIVTEGKYTKKSLLKAMTQDDGDITTTDGKEYVVYKYAYNRRLNNTMWQDDVVVALDQDGEEWEIKYSDIASYNESTVIDD